MGSGIDSRRLCSLRTESKGYPRVRRLCENEELSGIEGAVMMQEKYPVQQKLAKLKTALDSDPTNVEVANRYWVELASFGGDDVRSGGFVVEAFRRCALSSQAGVVAFARAYRELFEKSGEKPRVELFDEALLQALKTRLPELSKDDQVIVRWVLASIE